MSDSVSKQLRSKTMRAIRSRDTKIERFVASQFSKQGFRFRRNVNSLPGKPDFALKKYKIVVFIDSCFWHGCKIHCRMPNSNKKYWMSKIERNKTRDVEVNEYYNNKKWNLFRFWEHDINNDFKGNISMIRKSIIKQKRDFEK